MKVEATIFVMIFAATISLALSAAVTENGKADGNLTVAGKTIKLAYAYASSQEGFFDPKTKDTVVLLTDMPLDAKALADKFVRSELVRAGKLHTVEVIISAKKQPVSVSIRHNAFKTPYSGGSSEDVFTPEIFDAKTVAGRVFRESPGESFDDIVFTYDVRFHASIK